MEKSTKDNLIYRIVEYAYNNEIFDIDDLKSDLKLTRPELDLIHSRYIDKRSGGGLPSYLLVQDSKFNKSGKITQGNEKPSLRALPSAIFHYIEFMEPKEARSTAKQSFIMAKRSIRLAIFAVLVSGIVGIAQIIVTVCAN